MHLHIKIFALVILLNQFDSKPTLLLVRLKVFLSMEFFMQQGVKFTEVWHIWWYSNLISHTQYLHHHIFITLNG